LLHYVGDCSESNFGMTYDNDFRGSYATLIAVILMLYLYMFIYLSIHYKQVSNIAFDLSALTQL